MSGMVINTNVSSITAQRHLASSRAEMEQAMERLSSGKRINSAMDDAAGLTIAHSLDSKITSLTQATRNANDGVALINLAEGALDEVSAMLTRMKEIATQALNGTYTTDDLANLDSEYQQLSDAITDISTQTEFNGVSVLNGFGIKYFQVGDTSSDFIGVNLEKTGAAYIGSELEHVSPVTTQAPTSADEHVQTITIADQAWAAGDKVTVMMEGQEVSYTVLTADVAGTDAANTDAIGAKLIAAIDAAVSTVGTTTATTYAANVITITGDTAGDTIEIDSYRAYRPSERLDQTSITSSSNAQTAFTSIDGATTMIDRYRARLGAIANRTEHAANNLMSRVEHQSAARSRIQDADYAVESANLAKAQVLQQAGTAMLAQANASTQNILSLLK